QLAFVVSEPPPALRSGPTTILPLGFRGHAVGFSLLLAQPFAKCNSVIPTDADQRIIVLLLETRIQPVRICVHLEFPIRESTMSPPFSLSLRLVSLCLYELSKLPDCDLGLPHVERVRDLDLMLRTFAGQAFPCPAIKSLVEPEVDFLLRRSHCELTGRDE